MMKRLQELTRSPVGRVLMVLVGLGVVSLLVWKSGPAAVWAAVTRSATLFGVVLLLEVALGGTDAWAAVLMYGPDRKKFPLKEVLRVSMLCYSLIGVLPFGRAAGEATRSAMYARYVGMPLAAASAVRMQALSLVGNAIVCIPCAWGVYVLLGPSLLLAGVGLHFVITGAVGGGLILMGRRSMLATNIGKLFRGGASWGPAVDEQLRTDLNLWPAMAVLVLSRLIRVGQRLALLAAVGGAAGLPQAFTSESVNLVSSMVGDLIPSQMGVTEAGYAVAAQYLALTQSDAVAMALLVHFAQILCIGLGFLSPLLGTGSAPGVKEHGALAQGPDAGVGREG
jgi:hypothetical protein